VSAQPEDLLPEPEPALDLPVLPAQPSAGFFREAGCRGVDPNVFFPDDGDADAEDAARAVCMHCPVKASCREYALENRVEGFWGGMTERERDNVRHREKKRRWRAQRAAEGKEKK
jgi:WhiB family redox-sensing transcriptional regulator